MYYNQADILIDLCKILHIYSNVVRHTYSLQGPKEAYFFIRKYECYQGQLTL